VGVTYVVVRHLKFPSRLTFMRPLDRMVIFFIALLLFCFSISNRATRIAVSIMSVLVAVLIIWCIRATWETTEGEDVWRDNLNVFRRARSNLFKRVKDFNPFRARRPPRHVPHPPDDQFTLTDRLGRV
jgi:hypothetical protein